MRNKYTKYLRKRGYLRGVIFNFIIYGLIYKIFGFEWAVVLGLAHINSDQDWTNILLFRLKPNKGHKDYKTEL